MLNLNTTTFLFKTANTVLMSITVQGIPTCHTTASLRLLFLCQGIANLFLHSFSVIALSWPGSPWIQSLFLQASFWQAVEDWRTCTQPMWTQCYLLHHCVTPLRYLKCSLHALPVLWGTLVSSPSPIYILQFWFAFYVLILESRACTATNLKILLKVFRPNSLC